MKTKRILSLVLAALMVLSLVPMMMIGATAADANQITLPNGETMSVTSYNTATGKPSWANNNWTTLLWKTAFTLEQSEGILFKLVDQRIQHQPSLLTPDLKITERGKRQEQEAVVITHRRLRFPPLGIQLHTAGKRGVDRIVYGTNRSVHLSQGKQSTDQKRGQPLALGPRGDRQIHR